MAPARFVDDVLGALFPAMCPCGSRGAPCCERCALTLAPAPASAPPSGIDWWLAPYAYQGVARELVARAKYRGGRAAIEWFGEAIARACRTRVEHDGLVVTWAPASEPRRRANGVDHGALLARSVARHLDVPARRLLLRQAGPAQTGADRLTRRHGPVLRVHRLGTSDRVLLVDDVATTGATLAAAARALRASGVRSVAAATATRTPGPGRS